MILSSNKALFHPPVLENNSLEKYLKHLNSLRKQTYDMQLSKNLNDQEKNSVFNKFDSKIKNHKENCRISPRSFDVFKNKAELARIKFELEYPEPVKPIVEECLHKNTENRIQVDRIGRSMVVSQCQSCGKHMGFIKKDKISNWQSLKEFNQHWRQLWGKYHQWEQQRHKAYRKALIEGDNLPLFDEGAFDEEYFSHSKVFYNETCKHERKHVTKRIYNNASPHAVEQCLRCGKHLITIPKKNIRSIADLPLFDEKLEDNYRLNSNKYLKQYWKEKVAASNAFDAQLEKDIQTGKFTIHVNSTFNTYYDSDEWQKTRIRIFTRDKNKCQVHSCKKESQCVHHLTYERIGCENDMDLISLCNSCHTKVHNKQDSYPYYYRILPSQIIEM